MTSGPLKRGSASARARSSAAPCQGVRGSGSAGPLRGPPWGAGPWQGAVGAFCHQPDSPLMTVGQPLMAREVCMPAMVAASTQPAFRPVRIQSPVR
jgi:hypothetical protein